MNFAFLYVLVTPIGADPQLSFTDITERAGTGGPAGKTGGHGAAWADVTGDGRPDLYITMIFNDPMADLFFRNADGTVFLDEGAKRGIADFDGGSHGGTWADLDNDGDFDLLNGTTWNLPDYPNHNNLFRNGGDGTFREATPEVMKNRIEQTRGTLCFDLDADGDLDIFCVSGWMGSGDPPGERNELYRNEGNFRFQEILDSPLCDAPCGQGATDTDLDGDGDIDVIACNRDGDLNIFRNDGKGSFSRVPPATIGITHRAYSGVTTGDLDNDGDLDLVLVGSDDRGRLYRNKGDGTFTYLREFSSIDGYMGGFADLDNDGDLDLVFAGDDVSYLNDGTGKFQEGPRLPVSGINDPRAVAFADIDGDGDLDFAFGVKRSRNWLIRNEYSGGNHWLKVKLISPQGQIGSFGTKVLVFPAGRAGGKLLGYREARSNSGYLGQDDPVLHFGLDSRPSVDVTVKFLDGTEVIRSNVTANQTITIDGRSRIVGYRL